MELRAAQKCGRRSGGSAARVLRASPTKRADFISQSEWAKETRVAGLRWRRSQSLASDNLIMLRASQALLETSSTCARPRQQRGTSGDYANGRPVGARPPPAARRETAVRAAMASGQKAARSPSCPPRRSLMILIVLSSLLRSRSRAQINCAPERPAMRAHERPAGKTNMTIAISSSMMMTLVSGADH